MFATADEAEAAFYDALEHADLARLMLVWADDEEIACILPGGMRVVGHAAVRAAWRDILAAGPALVRPSRIVAIPSMMSMVHTLIERIAAPASAGPRAACRYATNVYHKGPNGWRLVLHHACEAPADAALIDQRIPDLLH